jgi:hypothetical protein
MSKLVTMARELLAIEEDLPFRLDYNKERNVTTDDFEIHIFEQVWGSTALGFGGMGGQAITSATTYVLVPIHANARCFVYFAGRFAYPADYCEEFKKDLIAQRMVSVRDSGKYRNN